MKNYFYKYVPPSEIDDNIRQLIIVTFHDIKKELNVVCRFNTFELIPVYYFTQVEREADADFSSDVLWSGYHRRDSEHIGIDPYRKIPSLLNTIAHECKHIRQFRNLVDELVKKGHSPDEIRREVFVETCPLRGERPVDHSDYEADFEREARDFGKRYENWGTAMKYFRIAEKWAEEYDGLLSEYDSTSMLPLKGKNNE